MKNKLPIEHVHEVKIILPKRDYEVSRVLQRFFFSYDHGLRVQFRHFLCVFRFQAPPRFFENL